MAESIVKIPQVKRDYDFIAFSFKGKHSYEDYHIYRVSDGSRYNENITPTLTDKTADVPGGDGMYFFGTECKQRNFTINFAFCDLTEREITDIRTWLDGKEMGDLWFAEEPHKVYTAKVTGTPTLKYLPFDERRGEEGKIERVYKGEGNVTFTAYWPYAHTPDYVESTDGVKLPGMYYGSYTQFSNYRQLKEVLPQSIENNTNAYGDLPFHFKAKLLPPHSTSKIYITSSKGGDAYRAVEVNGLVLGDDGRYEIESKQSTVSSQLLDLSQVRLVASSNTPYCFAYEPDRIVLSNQYEDDYSGISHNSYAYSTLYFKMPFNGNLVVSIYQESKDKNADFGIISHLDTELSDSHVIDTNAKYIGKNCSGDTVITYNLVSEGDHYITLKYYKDYDDGGTDDCFDIIELQAITL